MKIKIKREYLPSDDFIARAIIIAIVIAFGSGIFYLGRFVVRKISNKSSASIKISELVIKDSNKNGIADWEESLWGLDPTKNGTDNKTFILAKKQELNRESGDTQSTLSKNDKLAREFFALITSLQQSGTLNDETIGAIGDAIGKQATATDIPDTYGAESIKTLSTTPASIRAYHAAFSKLALSYGNSDIGNELIFISQAIDHNESSAISAAKSVARAYKSFAQELVAIPVPKSLIPIILPLANNYDKTGTSILEMSSLIDDQFAGMRGIVNYKRYNDALLTNLDDLKSFFERNGILK